ncbi:hypothetical protein [Streptomyces sp. NBC_00162]|uniref:hypothetical protein n=1 Tax=Streptomyces sp. NBC_00162 TaxID=2903629 RepID=UPI003A4C7BA4
MLAQGHSRRAIARHLGWGLNTVLRYANAARRQDTIRGNRPRPYKPYLERRFAEGCTSVTRLHSELVVEQAPRLRRVPQRPPRLHTSHLDRRCRCQPVTRPHRLRTPPAPRSRRRDSWAHSGRELRQHRGAP